MQQTFTTVNADTQAASIAALEQEMKDMQSERAKVSKLRAQLEQASTRMNQEKAAWERQKVHVAIFQNTLNFRDVHVGIPPLQQVLLGVFQYCALFLCPRRNLPCNLQLQWESLLTCSSDTLQVDYCEVCLATAKQQIFRSRAI